MLRFEAQLTGTSLKTLVVLGAAGVMLAPMANAEVAAGVSAGISRSDNIRRVDDGETEESVGSVNVNFDVAEKSARSRTTLAGNLSYLNYLEGTFDDEVVGSVSADAVVELLADRLELVASDTFGQQAVQSFAAVTPDNRENVNVFSLGPRLTLGGESRIKLELSSRYSNLSYEKTTLDSDRIGGNVALIRQISTSSTVSLNGDYEEVDYDDDLRNTDFDRSQYFVRYRAKGGRTELSVDAGINRVGGSIEAESGFLGRLQLSRRVSPYATFVAALGRELSDAGNDFGLLQNQPTEGVGTQSVQNVSGPFTSNSASLGLGYERGRIGFSISGSVFDEQFDDQPLSDRTRSVVGATARRDLTPTVSFSLSAQRMREEYEIATRNFSEVYAAAVLSWRLGPSLTTLAQVERFDRNARISSGEYNENRISLRAAYNFGAKSRTTAAPVPVQTGMFR